MDVDAASHRENYRGRANARMGGTTSIARSTHPCSTGSLWRRYAFAGGDAVRKDGAYALTTSEKVIEDGNDGAGEELTIYEADGMGNAVSNCLGCNFIRGDLFEKDNGRDCRDGHSGAGFYRFGTSGDRVEWTLDAEESEMRPISFRHSLGKTNTGLKLVLGGKKEPVISIET